MSDGYAAADLRDYLLRGDDGEVPRPEAIGLESEAAVDVMVAVMRHYPYDDPDVPDDPMQSAIVQSIIQSSGSRSLQKAVEQGNLDKISYWKGITGTDKSDAGTFELVEVIRDLFKPGDRDHMLNLVIYAPPPPVGPTGVGKTDFAYTVIEGAEVCHDDISVSSNNTTDPYDDDVQSWSELESWLSSTSGTKLFMWDEAAQVLQFSDMDAGKALSQLIKLLRKHNCHLIVVGHTGKDIPRDVRRMVMFCQKTSKKEAVIGAGLTEDQKGWMKIDNVTHRIENIPATSVEYSSTGDTGEFVFDQKEKVEEDEKYRQCYATNKDDSPCSKTAMYPRDNPKYCGTHKHEIGE